MADLFFDDWNTGSDLAAGATLADVGGGGFGMIPQAAWLDAGSKVLGAALSPSPAGPSRADSSAYSALDASGWNVATGQGARIDSNRAESDQLFTYAALAAGFILLWRWTRKH